MLLSLPYISAYRRMLKVGPFTQVMLATFTDLQQIFCEIAPPSPPSLYKDSVCLLRFFGHG